VATTAEASDFFATLERSQTFSKAQSEFLLTGILTANEFPIVSSINGDFGCLRVNWFLRKYPPCVP